MMITELKYCIEDTVDKCYRDFSTSLSSRGWKRVAYRKRTKLEKKRLPLKDAPSLVCTLNEKDLDFSDLNSHQICNHFDGIECLTTKRGYCELLKDLNWICENEMDITPRCYNLGDPTHRQEFTDEFRMAAALNILKWFVLFCEVKSEQKRRFQLKRNILRNCFTACTWHLKIKSEGEWPGVDISTLFRDQETCLDEQKWNDILLASYEINESDFACSENILRDKLEWRNCSDIYSLEVSQIRARLILRAFSASSKQFYMDGMRNIWVVKAAESSCGKGIKLFYKLEDIIDWDRGLGGRTAQKYVETPLLAVHSPSLSPRPEDDSQSLPTEGELRVGFDAAIKFDLRVWVLITSVEPLKAFIYSRVYGRSCSSAYSNNVKALANNYAHLTNYSVQKKRATHLDSNNYPASGAEGEIDIALSKLGKMNNSTNKLRSVCNSFRFNDTANYSDKIEVTDQELLLSHSQVVEIITSHVKRLQAKLNQQKAHGNCESLWASRVWPEIKRKILITIEAARDKLVHRNRSFEFLGYDILLDEQLNPWILEANMSPAMAHRSEEQSNLIANMCEGMVNLAVLPWVDSAIVPTPTSAPSFIPDEIKYGSWEVLQDETMVRVEKVVQRTETPGDTFISDWAEVKRPPRPKSATSNRKSINLPSGQGRMRPSGRLDKKGSGLEATLTPSWCSPNIEFNTNQIKEDCHDNYDMDWAVAKESIAPSTAQYICTTNTLQSLEIIGKSISDSTIATIDTLCYKLAKLLLLQRWCRKYMIRTRLYHARRKSSVIVIQCALRLKQSRTILTKLRFERLQLIRRFASIKIQSHFRRILATSFVQHRREEVAAVKIQCLIRTKLAKERYDEKLKERCLIRILSWYNHRCDVRRRKAAFKIVMTARKWCNWRKRCRRIIFHSIAFWYRKKRRRIRTIQRAARQKLCRLKLARTYRLVRLKILAKDAVLRWNEYRNRMLTKEESVNTPIECAAMKREETLSINMKIAQTVRDLVYGDMLPVVVSNALFDLIPPSPPQERAIETTLDEFLAKSFAPSPLKKEIEIPIPSENQKSARKARRSSAGVFDIHDFIAANDTEENICNAEKPVFLISKADSDYERQLQILTRSVANDELLKSTLRKSISKEPSKFSIIERSTTAQTKTIADVERGSNRSSQRPSSAQRPRERSVSFNLTDAVRKYDIGKVAELKPNASAKASNKSHAAQKVDKGGATKKNEQKQKVNVPTISVEKISKNVVTDKESSTNDFPVDKGESYLSLSSNVLEVERLLQIRRSEQFLSHDYKVKPPGALAESSDRQETGEHGPSPRHEHRNRVNNAGNEGFVQLTSGLVSKESTNDENAIFSFSLQQANTILLRSAHHRNHASNAPASTHRMSDQVWQWTGDCTPIVKLASSDRTHDIDTRSEKSSISRRKKTAEKIRYSKGPDTTTHPTHLPFDDSAPANMLMPHSPARLDNFFDKLLTKDYDITDALPKRQKKRSSSTGKVAGK